MPTVQDFYRVLNELVPFSLAESWDNVGLLIGSGSTPVRGGMLALDVTGAVIDEALEKGANLIVTHHPVIFKPMKSIAADSIAYRLIREDIHVISAHTNLDIARGGVNDELARRIGLTDVKGLAVMGSAPHYKVSVMVPAEDTDAVFEAMSGQGAGKLGNYSHCGFFVKGEGRFKPLSGARPHTGEVGRLECLEEVRLEMLCAPENLAEVIGAMKEAHPYEEPAYDIFHNYALESKSFLGRIGRLPEALSPEALASLVKERLGVGGVRYVPGTDRIDTVAVCGGSGADLIYQAKAQGAQALVTGESKHNLWLEAGQLGITLIDAEHFSTEAVVLKPLCARLRERIAVPIGIAASSQSNIRYL